MQINNYDQWLELKFRTLEPGEPVYCLKCDGTGDVVETCHCCDNESEQPCSDCDGDGYKPFKDISTIGELSNYFNEEYYLREVFKDLTDLAIFTGDRPLNIIAPFVLDRCQERHVFDPFSVLCDAAKGRIPKVSRRIF